MKGKTVLVTGASSGIGLAAATALARMGARVLMVCRDAGRGERARAAVAGPATGPAPQLWLADLSSQRQIHRLAETLHRQSCEIDVLINNAAAIFAQRELTEDGIEKTFATNHLAPFLLTLLVGDLIVAGGRIVNVASEDHATKLEFDNLGGEKHYNFLAAYRRSKLCNILFTYELARRMKGAGITVNCVSPGPTGTRFGYNMAGLAGLVPRVFMPVAGLFVSPEQGAHTLVHLASSPDVAGITGQFFLRMQKRQTKPVTYDTQAAARLWDTSANLAGLESPALPRLAATGKAS
jgi:NAD(P)-dependent dehydrogenase (short-subunit alcohol dehydrogenase family)